MEHKKPDTKSRFAEVTKKAQQERAKKPKQSRESVNHFASEPERELGLSIDKEEKPDKSF